MGPWSPPIWSRDWGLVLFFNQYGKERRREMREIERVERVSEREIGRDREKEKERER